MNPSPIKNQQNSRLPEIGAIILVVLAAGYYFYSSSGSNASSSSSFTVSSSNSSVGTNVLNLLNQIHSLNIDTSFFQTKTYQSLTDFTITIPSESVGKANPFLPFSASAGSGSAPAPDLAPVSSTTSSSVKK